MHDCYWEGRYDEAAKHWFAPRTWLRNLLDVEGPISRYRERAWTDDRIRQLRLRIEALEQAATTNKKKS